MNKYTFLLPAYKGKYLERMLTSIHNQTYSDFEVIVSDDCSPDDILSIVQPFLSDKRFHYRRNESNIGAYNLVDHWNLLLNICHSEFLIIASDDDFYECEFLDEIDKLVNKFGNVSVYRPLIRQINENMHQVNCDQFLFDKSSVVSCQDFILKLGSGSICSGISQYVFRKDSLTEIGGFYAFPYAWFSDDAIAIMMASKNGIAICPQQLFTSCVWSNSISGATDGEASIIGKTIAAAEFNELMKTLPSDIDITSLNIRTREVTLGLYQSCSFYDLCRYLCSAYFNNRSELHFSYCEELLWHRIKRHFSTSQN